MAGTAQRRGRINNKMRKIILNLAVSLDGFIEGPNGEYDWCLNDQDYGLTEFFNASFNQWDSAVVTKHTHRVA